MNREGCYRTRWRWLMLAVFVLLALGGCLLSVMQGVAAITPADVLQIDPLAAVGPDGGSDHLEYPPAPDADRSPGRG